MLNIGPHLAVLCALGAVVGACVSPAPRGDGTGTSSDRARGPKRAVAAIYGDPSSLIERMNTAQVSIPGSSAVEQLVHAALTEVNGQGKLQPLLAEAVPSIENGLWRVLPDGRMETTWKIRAEARWQDRAPLVAEDFVFATVVDQDRDLPISRHGAYQSIESVEAVDPRSVLVRWKAPYIDADTMFTQAFASALPRHLLEEAYLKEKESFLGLPYWSHEFVGTGPFALREFAPGSHVLVQANDGYAFGRPKVDEIEVRFILDLNTITTNIVAGAVDMTLGRGFSIEQALAVRAQFRDGTVSIAPRSWIVIHPQFINPNPAIIGDVEFRRALMYATDRQGLMDSLQGGQTAVAHVFLSPSEPEYRDVEDAVVRYEYDPRRAAQGIEGLGFAKGSDGAYRDSGGQRLIIELRTYGVKVSDSATVSISDAWTRLGVTTEPVIVPPQRIRDREYMATFPGFLMYRQPNTASARDVSRLRGSLAPVPENGFVGSNYARYVNPDFDALIDRYLTAIPKAERMQVLRQFVRHISEQLNLMGLFYDAEISIFSNRLQNLTASETRLWNVHEWDIR